MMNQNSYKMGLGGSFQFYLEAGFSILVLVFRLNSGYDFIYLFIYLIWFSNLKSTVWIPNNQPGNQN
jgi:hypothetical protein